MTGLSEAAIEKTVSRRAVALGFLSFKFVSPGNRSVPDRLYIKYGITFYIEYKAPGEQPTKQQKLRIEEMKAAGAIVAVIDNVADGFAFFQWAEKMFKTRAICPLHTEGLEWPSC